MSGPRCRTWGSLVQCVPFSLFPQEVRTNGPLFQGVPATHTPPTRRGAHTRGGDNTEQRTEGRGSRGWQSSPSPLSPCRCPHAGPGAISCHTLSHSLGKNSPLCPDKLCPVDEIQINQTTWSDFTERRLPAPGPGWVVKYLSCLYSSGRPLFAGAGRGKTGSAEQVCGLRVPGVRNSCLEDRKCSWKAPSHWSLRQKVITC